MKHILPAAALLVFSACEAPVSDDPSALDPASVSTSITYSKASSDALNVVMDDETVSADFMRRDMDVQQAVLTAGSAREASAATAAILSKVGDAQARGVLAESAALYVLNTWGNRADSSDLPAVAAATDVLVRRGSPEAMAVDAGLRALSDEWTTARVQAAAASTLAALDARGEKRCRLCDGAGTGDALGLEVSTTVRETGAVPDARMRNEAARRDDAVRRLEQIAG